MTLLRVLDPKEAELFASGEEEVREMLEDLGISISTEDTSADVTPAKTVGSLID
ncbi:hypothetical protein [Muricomes intestini]